jgi:hypothetical protein
MRVGGRVAGPRYTNGRGRRSFGRAAPNGRLGRSKVHVSPELQNGKQSAEKTGA